MRPLAALLTIGLVLLPGLPRPAGAQTATATLSASLGPVVRLSVTPTSLTFPDADPDLVPVVEPASGPLTITARARALGGSQIVLTVQATDHLRSGATTIDIGNLEWIAAGPGFLAGVVSRDVPRTVASWVGSGLREGTQTYRFKNLWTHPTGIYTVTLLYTLAAP